MRFVPLAPAALLAFAPMVHAMTAPKTSAPAVAIPAAATVAPLNLPPITEVALDNGLAVVTVQKRDLPLVAVRLVVPTGSARDPLGKEGIASFTAQLLRRGTAKRSAEEVDDAIESIGGLLGVEANAETTGLGVTVPSEHVATALDVIADLVQNPSFPKKEFDLARRRELAHLQQDLDDPSGIAETALVEFFYGHGHPYGHPGQGRTASVKKFQRADVTAFHETTFTPHGAMLLFVGDIAPAEALALARKSLGGWKGRQLAPVDPPAPQRSGGVEILLVDKPDATQAQVRVIVPGIARKDPRYYAAIVANTILGGGFTSRLVDEVRVNKGLSYSVSTRVVGLPRFGAVTYSSFTKTETLRELLDVSFGVLGLFRDKGPTQDEVEKAKRYMIGMYPARVESNEQLGEALSSARFQELPFEVIAQYRAEVAAAPMALITDTAQLFPWKGEAKVVIVGAAAKIKPQLEGLGKLTVKKVEEYQ